MIMKKRERENDNTDAGDDSRKRAMSKKRICRFCADFKMPLDYKEPKLLSVFVSDRGKIIPRHITGNCAFHQRRIQEAVKRSRVLALLPFTTIYQG